MVDRRSFLKSLAAGGAVLALDPAELLASGRNLLSTYFGVHAFVESHPDAVFIMRTNVDAKTNSAAVLQAGLAFGSSVFVPMDTPGVPIAHRVAIKPNIVMMPAEEVQYMGIVTDPYFVEGVIQSLKLVGIQSNQFYIREVNNPDAFAKSGYSQMAARTGADLRDLDDPVGVISESDLQWVDVPNGKWFKRIPFLWPVNDPNTWLLNISKFKTHLMGMSLCAKNIQGAIAAPYQAHCTAYNSAWAIDPANVQPDAKAHIWDDYQRHVAAGIPRWDRPGEEGGVWQEIWAARCLDNNSITHPGLHVIEGVYGREGAFWYGPGPDGEGIDHLTNMIIFGKNPFHVDNIGIWLGGHEPGNFGFLHLAIERGQASILNPHDIQLYEWFPDGTYLSTHLDNFTRASLRTNYLRRDYGGQVEDEWHLVNEPYTYEPVPVQLISFAGSIDQQTGYVTLRWSTASETNNYGFEVQKAATNNGPAYETIANSFVAGHGTTIKPHVYSFTDVTAVQGSWYYRLKQIDLDGIVHFTEGVRPTYAMSVDGQPLPAAYSLDQNYPNPYNPSTTIRYGLPERSKVTLTVYGALGQQVAVLQNGEQEAGYHEVKFDGKNLSSGLYFYRLQAGDFVETKRLLLLR